MKKWTVLLGFAALCLATGVGAQTLLTNLSVSGNVTAGITAIDYRYTRHTRSGSGRGGHSSTYYSWDPYTDEQINGSLAMVLGGSSGATTATGTYYAPTYSATASGATSLSNSATAATFTTTYTVYATLDTPQVAHQRVTATADAGSTFYFTLNNSAKVTITATGSANGSLALYGQLDEGVGVIIGLSGPGKVATSSSLGPGYYWITSSTGSSAVQDTQLNTFLAIGATDASYSFKVSFKKSAGDD
jgi:hypothetical protein